MTESSESQLSIPFVDGDLVIFTYFVEKGCVWYSGVGSVGVLLEWGDVEPKRWSNYATSLPTEVTLERGSHTYLNSAGLFMVLPKLVKAISLPPGCLAVIYRAILTLDETGTQYFLRIFRLFYDAPTAVSAKLLGGRDKSALLDLSKSIAWCNHYPEFFSRGKDL